MTPSHSTSRITVISIDHVLVTNAHGTYPVHRGWLSLGIMVPRNEHPARTDRYALRPVLIMAGERVA